MEVSREQIRAARAQLGWSAERLAREAGCSLATVQRCEKGSKTIPVVRAAIVAALKSGGIEFLPDGGAAQRV